MRKKTFLNLFIAIFLSMTLLSIMSVNTFVLAEETTKKTTWDYKADFAQEQGENGFTYLWGEDYDSITTDQVIKTDPFQWKGPLDYSIINHDFLMPDRGVVAVKWTAPRAGLYEVNLLTYWIDKDNPDTSGAVDGGFNGAIFGINAFDGTELFKLDAEHDYLVDDETQDITTKQRIFLQKDEYFIYYVDAKVNGGWDNYPLQLTIDEVSFDYKADFAQEQGENGFTYLWGEDLDSITTDQVIKTDPFQWKGPLDFSVINHDFLMPDIGVVAVKWTAPFTGDFNVNLATSWSLKDNQTEIDNATNGGFNGAIFGIRKEGAESDLFNLDADVTYLSDDATQDITTTESLTLNKGESVLAYIDAKEHGGWDSYDFALSIETVNVPTETISITTDSTECFTGQTIQLNATTDGISSEDIVWSSSDDAIATVDENGLVEGNTPGNVTITAEVGDATETIDLTINERLTDTTVTITGPTEVQENKSITLSATIENAPAGTEAVWTSLDETIATVDENGVVQGLSEGTVSIKVVAGEAIEVYNITVTPGVVVEITAETKRVKVDETITLNATAQNTDETTITWSSSNESIAIVDGNGVVTGEGVGYVGITATIDGVSTTAVVKVTRDYSTDGTLWDFYSDFPEEHQGENNFFILWGPSGDYNLLSDLQVTPSIDEPDNEPQQWKGGSEYATIAQPFILPGDGTSAIKFLAPEDGTYILTFEYYWRLNARTQIVDLADAVEKDFDGVEIGILKNDGTTNTELYKQVADYEYLTNPATEKTLVEVTVTLNKDESVIIYVDCMDNGGYDDYSYELNIRNTDYTGPKQTVTIDDEDDDENTTTTTTTEEEILDNDSQEEVSGLKPLAIAGIIVGGMGVVVVALVVIRKKFS